MTLKDFSSLHESYIYNKSVKKTYSLNILESFDSYHILASFHSVFKLSFASSGGIFKEKR